MTDIFIPKPFAQITADMVEHVRGNTDRLTDFNVGSVIRTLLEANAVELDDYYQAIYLGLLRAIPTAIYLGFGFDTKAAVAASGSVDFAVAEPLGHDLIIPIGTRLVSNAGYYYVTTEDTLIPAGQTSINVGVHAEVAGALGNADPGSLDLADKRDFSSTVSVTNPASILGGADQESEEQRAERFAAYILALARGTPAALEYAATLPVLYDPTTGVLSERVQRFSVQETPGHVNLYIHNGSYGASDELVEKVQTLIDGYRDETTWKWVGGYRPAGMRVDVLVMIDTPVSISMEISRRQSYVQSAVELAVQGALERLLHNALPSTLVRPADIVNAVLAVDGVTGATILSPTSSITIGPDKILYLDDLAITWVA